MVDGKYIFIVMKWFEVYNVVNNFEDEVFYFDFYEWYIEQGFMDWIFVIDLFYVIIFL